MASASRRGEGLARVSTNQVKWYHDKATSARGDPDKSLPETLTQEVIDYLWEVDSIAFRHHDTWGEVPTWAQHVPMRVSYRF